MSLWNQLRLAPKQSGNFEYNQNPFIFPESEATSESVEIEIDS